MGLAKRLNELVERKKKKLSWKKADKVLARAYGQWIGSSGPRVQQMNLFTEK